MFLYLETFPGALYFTTDGLVYETGYIATE